LSNIRRICALYSHGPHFVRLLRHLRAEYPDTQLVAFVPPDYPAAVIKQWADRVERIPGGKRGMTAFKEVLRQVRAERCDLLVVMFDSPKLRVLAAASGVRNRYYYAADGRYAPLRKGLLSSLLHGLWRQCVGRVRYAYIRHVVYHRPVQKP
jgi:ADP-heptose:LPS heptosyltransferase